MKGIVFTEFLEMVEQKYGLETVDAIIESAQLPNDGAYTAVGTYDHRELLRLVGSLSQATRTALPKLVHAFGRHLFTSFSRAYPYVFDGLHSTTEFLSNVEDLIHVEVRKLYPDAELPSIAFSALGDNRWELIYRSTRPFADLCQGLIEACAEHYQEPLQMSRDDRPEAAGTEARFVLTILPQHSRCLT
jgi:hypothetical protein